jgi:hypothetical protein
MIEFNRKGTAVVVSINTGVNVEKNVISMEWNCENEMMAQLLLDQLKDRHWKIVQDIRKEEYERGWIDKMKRKIKRDWFSTNFRKVW